MTDDFRGNDGMKGAEPSGGVGGKAMPAAM